MPTARQLAALVEARAKTTTRFLTFRGPIKTKPAQGYVSLYSGAGIAFADVIAGGSDRLRWSFRAVCVGSDEDESLYVLGEVRRLFLNWRPYPDDRSVGWFTEAPDDPPLIRDDSISNDIRYSITPRYILTT